MNLDFVLNSSLYILKNIIKLSRIVGIQYLACIVISRYEAEPNARTLKTLPLLVMLLEKHISTLL